MPRVTKKQRVREFAGARGWTRIGDAEWNELRSALADISEATIREAGLLVERPWRGVAQHTLDELEASLREMSDVYAARPDLRRYCRDQVIGAKDRARWVANSGRADEEKRRLKGEMVEWMLVWLDDPAMLPGWVEIRRGQLGRPNGLPHMSS